jgi:hypothetical protein
MTWTYDYRWAPGASRAEVPEDTPAAYSARWIDHGDQARADVLADRQGFAYSDLEQRDALCDLMQSADRSIRIPGGMPRDETVVMDGVGWKIAQRRSGGYIYVDAWLNPEEGS